MGFMSTGFCVWNAEVFPRDEAEGESPVMRAKCAVDRYGQDFGAVIFNEVLKLGYEVRLTRRLPENWQTSYDERLLWQKEEPKLLIIHLSCFQQGPETNDPGPNIERTEDFGRLLQTLRYKKVKVLVYSRAFPGGTDFLDAYEEVKKFKASRRLETFTLVHGRPFSEDTQGGFHRMCKVCSQASSRAA